LNFKIIIILIAFGVNLISPLKSIAQNEIICGILPSINLNKKVVADWAVNLKSETRYNYINITSSDRMVVNKFELIDISVLAIKKTGLKSNLIFGYMSRTKNTAFYHRFIQQITIKQFINNYKLIHRVGADQTISNNSLPTFRLRYRIATNFSLNGKSVDNNEFYLKSSIEELCIYNHKQPSFETRLVNMFGYKVSENNKFEIGFDTRLNNIFKNNTKQTYWLSVNWYLNI
jgi:hypothetical protein